MPIQRVVMIAGLCALPFTAALAQDPKPTQSSRLATVGVLAGVSSTIMTGKDAGDDFKRRIRPMFGAWVLVNLAQHTELEIDGLFHAKGFRASDSTGKFNFSVSYFEVPALLRFRFSPEGRVQPFVGVGAALGYRVRCSSNQTSSGLSGDLGCDNVTGSAALNVATTETSAVLAGGADLITSAARFTIGARFTRGLTTVLENSQIHNEALTLYLSIGKSRQY